MIVYLAIGYTIAALESVQIRGKVSQLWFRSAPVRVRVQRSELVSLNTEALYVSHARMTLLKSRMVMRLHVRGGEATLGTDMQAWTNLGTDRSAGSQFTRMFIDICMYDCDMHVYMYAALWCGFG